MLGAIIGDIVGSRFEFENVATPGFELFTADCSYTDDTICTIAIADAAMNHREYKDALVDWCSRYPDPMGGYGGRFLMWLQSADHLPQASYGNGSAMRVSPIGWLYDDFHEMQDEAMKTALPSHCPREGIRGAQCVATLIYWLRTVRITKDEVIGTVKQTFGYDIPDLKEVYRLGNEGHFDATCQETVPAAISCFLDSNNFEDAIRTAILAQGDTDTKGAICGSIAEAHYEIPEEMITKAYEYLPADMLEIVDQFYTTLQGHIKR